MLIALGESIIAIGVGAGFELVTRVIVAAAFGIVVISALWWLYFDVAAILARTRLTQASGVAQANLAREGYSYLHLPLVAGIVLFAFGLKTTLGESAIRLRVLATGSLQAVDFFSPCDAQRLSDGDLDIGSGAPLVLPDGFPGTAGTATPHPLVVVGKEGPIYLLNRDALGGYQQGSPNSCDGNPGHNGDNLASKAGKPPGENYGNWATPAMWPGDGGAIYVPYVPFGGAAAKFTAYRVINGFGQPALALAGQSQDRFGYGSSSAIITSDGTASGSGLVWIVWLPDSSGNNAELLAYDPNPTNGVLVLRGEWQIGQGNKFTTPTVNNSRIYIGARDGNVRAFAVLNQGATQAPPVPGSRATTQDQRPDREG